MSYLDLSGKDQTAVLRAVALEAAGRFGLDLIRCEVAAHAYNTTFAAETTTGARYALRVNTNSHSTSSNITAQQTWQQAISADTDVPVAEPLTTPGGQWCVRVDSPAFPSALSVTASSWLDGPDVGELDVAAAHQLGQTMAQLHQQSRNWAIPADASLPRFDTPLFGDEDLLCAASGLTKPQRVVLAQARQVTAQAFNAAYESARLQPIHADLHGGNLKWVNHRLAVFDFDDCGLGTPSLDLAVATYYLRTGNPAPERALRAGYAEVTPLPEVDPNGFEAMIAARQLLLANSLLASTTADLKAVAGQHLRIAIDRLRHWLQTGTFMRESPRPIALERQRAPDSPPEC